MIELLILRWLHLLGTAVLLGTGAGIAFFMLMAHRTRDPRLIAHVANTVVIGDWLFTASTVVLQPVTGSLLAWSLGWSLTEGWILLSLVTYVLVGACWLPVVWIQYRIRRLARDAVQAGADLPPAYFRLFRIWFLLGIPAFSGVLLILWLMLARPVL